MKRTQRSQNRKKDRRSRPLVVPISSMIDVIFLLLMFFVMTHRPSFLEAFAMVKHPGPNPSPAEVQHREFIRIRIEPGQYYIQDRPVQLSDVEAWFVRSKGLVSDITVLIKVSPRATEGEFVAILDMCNKLRLTNLNVMTLKE